MSIRTGWLEGLRGIGPAIIVASVVVGPGSILTSSKVGHEFGYSMGWVLVLAAVLMIGMVALAARLGVQLRGSVCDELAHHWGRPATAALGVVMFLVIAAYQSSNNIAVVTCAEQFIGSQEQARSLPVMLLVGLNGLIIATLYGLRSLYSPIERSMKFLVGVMIIGFLGNVIFARPSLSGVASGLVPTVPRSEDWLPLLGLFGTTFSVAGAFYQSYLVREKGWDTTRLRQGTIDSVVGISVLCLTTLVIMTTSAAVLHGQAIELKSASDVGSQLEPLFGQWGKWLFNFGLLAGALSSFLVNAMIGGAVLSDSLGLGSRMDQSYPKHFTVVALLFGMIVAIGATTFEFSRVNLIVMAQALTVIGMPMLATALLYLGCRRDDARKRVAPSWMLSIASVALVVSIVLAIKTAMSVWEKLS